MFFFKKGEKKTIQVTRDIESICHLSIRESAPEAHFLGQATTYTDGNVAAAKQGGAKPTPAACRAHHWDSTHRDKNRNAVLIPNAYLIPFYQHGVSSWHLAITTEKDAYSFFPLVFTSLWWPQTNPDTDEGRGHSRQRKPSQMCITGTATRRQVPSSVSDASISCGATGIYTFVEG